MNSASDATRLIGTWKQLSGTMEEVGTGVTQNSRKSLPNGYVNFSPDGRLMLISADSIRAKPAGEVPTAEEAEALFRSLIAYAGSYKVLGNQVTYEIDLSWNESWTGTKHVRFWQIDGDRLSISTPEMVNPWTGKRSVMRLTFQKVR
jgi:hypothetical protein